MEKIKPLPMLFKVTTGELKNFLFKYFKEKAPQGFEGSQFKITKKNGGIMLSAEVCFSVNCPLIEVEKSAKLTTLEIENPFKMSKELKDILKPFVKQNQKIESHVVSYGKGNRSKKFVIELDPVKTLWFILDTPPEGYSYAVAGAIGQKSNSYLQLALVNKKAKKKPAKRNESKGW